MKCKLHITYHAVDKKPGTAILCKNTKTRLKKSNTQNFEHKYMFQNASKHSLINMMFIKKGIEELPGRMIVRLRQFLIKRVPVIKAF